jgi:hypothetical protein
MPSDDHNASLDKTQKLKTHYGCFVLSQTYLILTKLIENRKYTNIK